MSKQFSFKQFLPIYAIIFSFLIIISAIGSRAVTVLAETRPLVDRKCVVIDPGHGGVDGGATSCTGVLESNINLQISLRLNDLLKLMGIRTLMIRSDDRSVYTQGNTIAQKKVSDLKQRVKLVNEEHTALLLSIHQNHFTDSRYYGPQVFYGREEGSLELARTMQASLTSNLCPNNNRQAKTAKEVYLLQKADCVALLIECGFISNPEEEQKLLDPAYQKELCSVIAAVCGNYLQGTAVT